MFPFGYLLSNRNVELTQYVIRRRSHDDWYFVSIELYDPQPVIWTPRVAVAKIFNTEEHVEEFKYHFLNDRPCDIVMLK